ncbi:NRDE family protein [Nocardia stercoris]|uniref:NRDE family protein n=1 Tax=Nocardia stercoris TaxID=2483361 RepID=A0A3M2KUQ2_9NOCA|nr:NRDE family protein [Nocardia stercoris]RMI28694.1 NRDE family protein [Nocardia stercoris]
MCLVLAGWRAHPEFRLIVAANRDEFFTRPTESLRWWDELPGMLAGRDVGAPSGVPGTWLGMQAQARRFAAVTNVRGPREARADTRSRGALLLDFLGGGAEPEKFLRSVAAAPDEYNGYNLLVSDLDSLWWHSNRSAIAPLELGPGLHGLSNSAVLASLPVGAREPLRTDTGSVAWPKVASGLTELARVVEHDPADPDAYFTLLADAVVAPDADLPQTGLPLDLERSASARFVHNDIHGTRASSVLLVRADGSFTMAERVFGQGGRQLGATTLMGRLELAD